VCRGLGARSAILNMLRAAAIEQLTDAVGIRLARRDN
jgi:hypothetical protein